MRMPRKRKAPSGGMLGASGCFREHPDTPFRKNPQGPRLFIQVSREVDGSAVSLHGYVGGRLVTIVRGLTADEANERAATEASERGIEVRNG